MSQLYASFADVANAEQAVGALLDHGMRQEDLTLVAHRADLKDEDKIAKTGLTPTTAADAGAGAVGGAGIGFGVGSLAALASIFVPGVGIVVGGGALASALTAMLGTMAAGAVAGGVTGYLVDQGMPSEVATDFESALHNGGAILTLHLPSNDLDQFNAELILQKYHAQHVGTYSGVLV